MDEVTIQQVTVTIGDVSDPDTWFVTYYTGDGKDPITARVYTYLIDGPSALGLALEGDLNGEDMTLGDMPRL